VNRIWIALGFIALGSLPAAAQTAIRVNCGGPAYTDAKAQVWQADADYNSGYVSSIAANVTGTADQKLYQNGRYTESLTKPMIYSFPVAAGSYHVNLYFAETYSGTEKVGGRVFNVKMQGNLVFQNLDVFAAAGANTALVKGADIIVTDGTATIEFDSLVNNAKVNAIEITQTVSAPEMKLNFMYPDGTPVTGTLNYNVATTATTMKGTQPLTSGQATCLLVASPSLLGLVGTMTVNLSLTDTAGHTLWQIALALNPASANFTSVQSSSLNVVVQKQ
jgi:malectin (di-glucose binding ER protein)